MKPKPLSCTSFLILPAAIHTHSSTQTHEKQVCQGMAASAMAGQSTSVNPRHLSQQVWKYQTSRVENDRHPGGKMGEEWPLASPHLIAARRPGGGFGRVNAAIALGGHAWSAG